MRTQVEHDNPTLLTTALEQAAKHLHGPLRSLPQCGRAVPLSQGMQSGHRSLGMLGAVLP